MRILVVGCGRMGAAIAYDLVRRGHGVAVIDQDSVAFERLVPWFTGDTVAGIGFDRNVLLQAGIERADGLAAVTDSDEVNVVTARAAKQFFRVPKVVARLYDPRKAEIYQRLGVQTISQESWGVHRAIELLCYSRLETVVSLGSGEVDMVESEIPHLLVGRPVSELTAPGEVAVVAISRHGKTFIPMLTTEFRDGDLVHLVFHVTSGERLKGLLGLR